MEKAHVNTQNALRNAEHTCIPILEKKIEIQVTSTSLRDVK